MELKESLEICIQIWDWLAEHPEHDKKYAVEFLDLPPMLNECACCEFTEFLGFDNCEDNCPLTGLWSDNSHGSSCLSDNSIFQQWGGSGTTKETTKYAKAIADAARKRLEDFTY